VQLRVLCALAFIGALAHAPVAPGQEPAPTLPPGSFVAGVDLSGLDREAARAALRGGLSRVHERPVRVRGRGRSFRIGAMRLGLRIGYERMIRVAFGAAARGEPVNVPLERSLNRRRLSSAVAWVSRRLHKPARSARARFGVRRVRRLRHRFGLAVDRSRLRKEIVDKLIHPDERRLVRVRLRRVRPAVTLRELRRIHRTYVSISRGRFILRLFKRLRVVRRYRIAVGAAGYGTPGGFKRVLSKQVNPAWHAPNAPWAGELAGQTIPPGDPRNPLKARWMGLGGGIGIHGTAESWSIGTRASHGCIRMHVGDVIGLYRRVPLGTLVLIR
jgi:hypothetical protein